MYFSPEQSINVSATKTLSAPVSGKGGVWCECEGSLLQQTHCRKKHLSCKMQHVASKKWETSLHWGIILSLNPNICGLYLLIFEGWTGSYVCREAAGYSFASLFMPSIFLWLVVNSILLLSTSGLFHGVWKLVNKNNCSKKRTAFLSCSTFKLSLDSKRSDVSTIKPQFSGIMYNPNNKSSIVFLVFHIRYAGPSVTAFPFSLTRVGLSA